MKRSRTLMFATLGALALLGCSDTASAQPQLTVSPATTPNSPLVFNNIPAGEISQSQPVTVGTVNGTTASVIIQVSPTSPWLLVTPSGSVNIPNTFSVAADTTTLTAGAYNGSFTVSVSGASEPDSITVYVSLTVTGVSALSANPPTLVFSAQAGALSGIPSSTPVAIASSVGPLGYSLQVNYNPPTANWLLLSTTQGSTTGPAFSVSVNPSVLSVTTFPVTFDATIVAQSTTTSDSVAITVQMTINSTTAISVSPASPQPFLYQVGTASDPASQQLSISATGGSTTFSVAENPPESWLVVSPLNGTASSTPAVVTLNVTPHELGLTPGTYSTDLIITPSGETALAPIPVTLVVAAHPLLQLSTNTLFFQVPFAGSASTQSLIVSSSGGSQVPFSVTSSESWLTASASGNTTPATLTVQVNPTSLNIQNYTGTLTLMPTNGDAYTETITVNLNVTSPNQLVVGPTALLFSYEIGQSPPGQQNVEVASTGQFLDYTVSTATANCGSNWLTASPIAATSTSSITVGVVTAGLTAGDCSGTVTISYQSGLGPATVVIPVTLAVSSSAELSIAMGPNFGVSTTPLGSGQFEEQIALTSTDPTTQVGFNASITNVSGGAWLGIAGATSGVTPQNLLIQISPAVLSIPGTYYGTLTISSGSLGSATLSLQISLTVTSSTTVTVTPLTLTFTEPQGGSPSAPQTVTLSSSPTTATYTAVINYLNGTGWLQISPTSGNTNGTITATILPNTLSQGQYNAQISLAFQDASTTATNVNVQLNVTAAQTVTVSPPSLGFFYQMGATAPSPLSLSIASTGGSATVAVSATSTGWLSVSSSGGATPQTISVSVNPSGLLAQSYSGSISVSAPGVLSAPIVVPVAFTVSAAPGPEPVTIINNATAISGVIAPGEEIAIKGNFLGPSTAATFSVDAQGGVASTLAGVQVLFDSNPGTPIYVSASQINVMVPYEINGRLSTNMVVTYDGGQSQSFPLAVASVAPGLFTNNFTGSGQVAAINQNGSYNGSAGSGFQYASRGSVISLYGTGGGQTNPPSSTGSVTPVPTNSSQLLGIGNSNVTAMVGGVPATVNFAGAAPGLITGVFQVNLVIPLSVSPGSAVPVTVTVDGVSTPIGTTIAVQ